MCTLRYSRHSSTKDGQHVIRGLNKIPADAKILTLEIKPSAQNTQSAISTLDEGLARTFQNKPIRRREFDAAWNVLNDNRDAISNICNCNEIPPHLMSLLGEKVAQVLSQGNLIEIAACEVAEVNHNIMNSTDVAIRDATNFYDDTDYVIIERNADEKVNHFTDVVLTE